MWVSKPFSGDTFGLGDRIRIHVNFTKVLNVVGEPQLTLTLSDSETRIVEYEGLDDERRKLLFFYDVQSEDRSPGGLGISADALILNGATIRDSGGNDADLDLGEQAISDDGGHKVDGSIDNPPAVRWAGLESRPASGDTYALGETIVFDVSFNEPVTVTGTPELTLMIGTEMRTAESTGLWDDGRGFGLEYEVQSADLDRDGISIAADALRLPGGAAIRDSAGNDANLDLSEHAISNDGEHKVDGIIDNPPAVGGLCCFSEPQSGDTFSLGERIGINVHFTEAVMVTGTPQVTLTLSDTETRPMDYDHTCCDDRVLIFYYEVQSADRSAGGLSVGTHALILNSGTIRDVNGNDAAVLDLGEHEYTAPDPNRKVDGGIDNPPVVQWADVDSRPVDNDTYALGEMIEIHVGFNEPVTVSGKPQLELSIGTDTRTVDMDSVCCDERMDHLRFRYTVQAADRDNDGISFAANALRLNGATIQDRGGNDADLDLGEHAIINDENHRIDGSIDRPPGVQWVHVSEPVSGDTFTRGDRIEIHVGFNESISVNGTPQLELSIGADTRTVDLDDVCCGDRMDHIKGEYTVQAEDRDSDGISIAANALSLNGATIQDSGGNDAEPDLGEEAISNDPNRKVDGSIVTAPRIRDIYFVDYGLPAADTYQLGDPIEVHVQFDKAVTMTGAPQLALTVGTQMRQMNCYRVWNKRVLFCNYRVQATDLDEDGVSVAANSLVLNGGTIKSSSDGTIDADLHHKAVAETPARKVEGSQVSIPVVSEISFSSSSPASDDTYELGELIWVRVVFDREVNVVSAPQLALVVGTETRQMTLPSTYLGRRQRLDFSYTVQETDRDADGISIPANTLQGGTVTHSFDSTVDADLTHAAVADDPTKKVDGSQVSAPKMAQSPRIWREPASSNTYARGETVQILVFFDKPVAITGTPQLALTIGTRTRPSYYSESITDSPDILVFEYVVQAEDRDVDGISVAANALDAGGGTITLSGHDDIKADLTHKAVPNNRDYKVDGSSASAPKVAAVRFRSFPTSDGTYEHGEMVEVEVIFDKAVAVTGAPRLALTIGTQTRQAMYDRTQYGRLLYFHYTVQAEDRDDDGISIAANALDAGDGAITLPGPDPVDADLTLQALADDPLHKVGAGPGPQLGCKPPMRAARVQSLQAAATQGDGEGQAPAFELTLELEENRDGSGQAVEVGCVALADGDRQFSYEITDGNDGSRFTVGTSDGMISYVGSGENAERTSEYALTVTATPQDAGTAPQLPVRIAIANVNDPGVVTLSTTQPVIGDSVTAELEDEDRGVQDVSWQWRRQGSNGAWTEIQGATAAEYTPVAADAGHSLQVRTSYVDEHGAQQAASPLTAAVDLDATRREQILKLGLASLGRSVASAAVDAIGQRFGSAAAAGAPDAMALDVTLNRQPLHFPDPRDTAASGRLASSVARALGVRVTGDDTVVFSAPSGATLLANSAFSVEHPYGAGRWGIWGAGNLSGFEGKVGGFEQKGSVLSAYLGVDHRFVPNALAGLAASFSQFDLTSTSETYGEATLKGTLLAAYPYGFWMPEEWLGLWGLAGFGTGAAELKDVAGSQDGEIRMWLGATGQRVELLSAGGLSLAAKSDGFVTGLTSGGGLPEVTANAWRARLLLEGGLEWRPEQSRLAGSVEVGARLDGGDAEQGLGAEAGAELSYAHTGIGLGLSGRGRVLLAHEDEDLRDWGVSATLRWEPPGLGYGPALAVTPVWGVPEGGAAAVWQGGPNVLAGLSSRSAAGNGALWLPDLVAVKLSYGVEVATGGRLVPYAEIDFEDAAARRVRTGATVDISDPAAAHGLLLEAFGQHEARDGIASYHFGSKALWSTDNEETRNTAVHRTACRLPAGRLRDA